MRKLIEQKHSLYITTAILSVFIFFSCKYDTRDLLPKPVASFTATPIAGQTNRYLLSSTSQNGFRYDWDKGFGNYATGKAVDTAYFPDAGTYTVRLFLFGHSGTDSAKQTITVAADDPAALTPFKMLTGNNTRKWKLAPEAGALWIGPDPGTTWWQNGIADLTTRSCLFNDEYTFTKTGSTMAFDSKGDFYVDEEGGNPWPAGMPAVGCYANSAIPAGFQAWANNAVFTFEVINNNKLKVNGTGAHLGLYKAGTPPDAALPAPAGSVTYDIVSITPTRLVLRLDYGWGAWKFVYVAI
ncbi:MAG: PKD domain-containing protein [Chitinophagaceae bacterium]|nr:PKD domain-containing protein [Chitinophagaceae bacterium]